MREGLMPLLLGLLAVAVVVALAVWVRVLQRRLARTHQEARAETHRLLDEMAAGFAHSFNEVLTPIIGRSQLAAQRVDDPQVRRWLGMIEGSAMEGATIVTRIKEVTRIRRDGLAVVDLNAVVKDAVMATGPRRRKDVAVRTLLGRPGPVPGDAVALRDALVHVIRNAIEARKSGSVAVLTSEADGEAVVAVTDSGPGMAPEVQRRIFDPFFTTKPGHTGLGLSFVYGIVSRHGGQIEVDSKPGRGTTVRFRLRTEGASSSKIEAVVPPPAVSGPPRCLLVDDAGDVRDMLREVLTNGGYQVATAGDGADGVEKFRREAFDLVVTDFAMPRLNGLQLASACKNLKPTVPIVMLSGWEVALSEKEFADHGVDAILRKPVKIEEILKAVATLRPASAETPAGDPARPEGTTR